MKASLYIHIPFCARKCAYCDFESYSGRLDRADDYISRVLEEARGYSVDGVPTVYLGGGTPSLLSAKQLERLLGGLFEMFPPEAGAEISMEANPGTVAPEFLKAAGRMGVNRLSFGVQAYQERLLASLGRIHSFTQAEASVAMAQDAGIDNINCDVMYGLPGQTAPDISETVERICALGIKHISCYSLILEEGTPLYGRVQRGEAEVPPEDEVCDMQDTVLAAVRKNGLERYEISNYALKGYECRHNIVYWTGGNYLGLGCAAHSFIDGERFSNPDFDSYMSGISHTDPEYVDKAGLLEEKLLLGTRMTRGIRLSDFGDKAQRLIDEASKPVYRGLICVEDGILRFTDAGFMVHNALVLELVNSL